MDLLGFQNKYEARLFSNTDDNNNKCYISILECFLKDHVTMKTGGKMLKIQLTSHYKFKYIYYNNRKQLFKTVLYGDAVFTWMWNLSLMLLLMANVIGCKMPPKHSLQQGGDRDTLQIPHWVWHMRQYGHQKTTATCHIKTDASHQLTSSKSNPVYYPLSTPHLHMPMSSQQTHSAATGSC